MFSSIKSWFANGSNDENVADLSSSESGSYYEYARHPYMDLRDDALARDPYSERLPIRRRDRFRDSYGGDLALDGVRGGGLRDPSYGLGKNARIDRTYGSFSGWILLNYSCQFFNRLLIIIRFCKCENPFHSGILGNELI